MTSCPTCCADPCGCGTVVVTPPPPVEISVVVPSSPTGPSSIIEIGPGQGGAQGPTGPTGPAGPDKPLSYVHAQGVSSAVWDINHALMFYPNVTVVDSAGTNVEGHIDYIDVNNIRLIFSEPFSGTAYLS